jgi:hypothetical protein
VSSRKEQKRKRKGRPARRGGSSRALTEEKKKKKEEGEGQPETRSDFVVVERKLSARRERLLRLSRRKISGARFTITEQ